MKNIVLALLLLFAPATVLAEAVWSEADVVVEQNAIAREQALQVQIDALEAQVAGLPAGVTCDGSFQHELVGFGYCLEFALAGNYRRQDIPNADGSQPPHRLFIESNEVDVKQTACPAGQTEINSFGVGAHFTQSGLRLFKIGDGAILPAISVTAVGVTYEPPLLPDISSLVNKLEFSEDEINVNEYDLARAAAVRTYGEVTPDLTPVPFSAIVTFEVKDKARSTLLEQKVLVDTFTIRFDGLSIGEFNFCTDEQFQG